MRTTIRSARLQDGPVLQEIERQSGQRFREVGLDFIADADPDSLELLAEYANGGRAWVCVDELGNAFGYVLVDQVDGNAHIAQVSVRPEAQGRGLGRQLLDRVREWAEQSEKSSITLTTFRHVPWNRPLYEHLGFSVLVQSELGPELSAIRDDETAQGLDPATRVCMRLELHPMPS
jgi:GNAT superfamily N-acetyltransferase